MRKQAENTFVLSDASEILEALVGLKDVRVLHYQRPIIYFGGTTHIMGGSVFSELLNWGDK
ncbi:MAG: hypothetical protein HKL82_04080 [Acidimicrobiaceae bacterium]|nr:hypothetical protein [Acidimicrobiaceae bacterium]